MGGIAYNSGMQLVDSMVMTHRIYCLKHPISKEVFYVGKTTKELKERLSGHIGSVNSNGSNKEKNDYIKAILDLNERPIIEELEVIYGTCYIHKAEASAREFYWMQHFTDKGIQLKNHFGVKTDPLCSDWERYVRDVKETKGILNNYYCGKTRDGVEVYDEEKMSDDGFELPKTIPLRQSDQYRREAVITYHQIYDDENPDYIRGSLEEY